LLPLAIVALVAHRRAGVVVIVIVAVDVKSIAIVVVVFRRTVTIVNDFVARHAVAIVDDVTVRPRLVIPA
jgi:hypothetical protein